MPMRAGFPNRSKLVNEQGFAFFRGYTKGQGILGACFNTDAASHASVFPDECRILGETNSLELTLFSTDAAFYAIFLLHLCQIA